MPTTAVAVQEAWGAALSRAKGDKVFDDPRLLRKSLKKVGAQPRRAGLRGVPCTQGLLLAGLTPLPRPSFHHPRSPQEAKLKVKKAAAWKERLSRQQEEQQAKQQKCGGGRGVQRRRRAAGRGSWGTALRLRRSGPAPTCWPPVSLPPAGGGAT